MGHYNSSLIVATSSSLTKIGYTFDNWNILNNGAGNKYYSGLTFIVPKNDSTLYAQ